jgi:uncharacterized protein (DUF433 family)
MSLVLEREAPPLKQEEGGAIRIGESRVLLELVIQAFQSGDTPETIVARYSTLSLSEVYRSIGYYLNHQETVDLYLQRREELAQVVEAKISERSENNGHGIRSRLLR